MVRRMNDTYPRAITLAATTIDLDTLVTDRYQLADTSKAFAIAAARQGDKVVVSVSR
jgi:L-iditol 2-dehydrogenase